MGLAVCSLFPPFSSQSSASTVWGFYVLSRQTTVVGNVTRPDLKHIVELSKHYCHTLYPLKWHRLTVPRRFPLKHLIFEILGSNKAPFVGAEMTVVGPAGFGSVQQQRLVEPLWYIQPTIVLFYVCYK